MAIVSYRIHELLAHLIDYIFFPWSSDSSLCLKTFKCMPRLQVMALLSGFAGVYTEVPPLSLSYEFTLNGT